MLAPSPAIALREQLVRRAVEQLARATPDPCSAEQGILLAYETAGVKEPPSIVSCGGPRELALALTRASISGVLGTSQRQRLFDIPFQKALAAAKARWRDVLDTDAVLADPTTLPPDRQSPPERTAIAVDAAIAREVSRSFRRRWVRLRHLLSRQRPISTEFSGISIGPPQLLALMLLEGFQESMRWAEDLSALRGLLLAARSSGWIVPFERICFVCARPAAICADEQGRLHNAEGPALGCTDGWAIWAWKGVEIPSWMIARPELVTTAAIDAEPDPVLRRCMIDILTPARFIATGRAARIGEDETGVLWRAIWTHRGVRLGTWTAVEVVDGTADRNGERKRYVLPVPSHVNSPREAVAWTYGLTAEQYAKLDLRT